MKYFNLTGLTSEPPTILVIFSRPHLQPKKYNKVWPYIAYVKMKAGAFLNVGGKKRNYWRKNILSQ